MANRKLPGVRKSAGRVSTSALKLVALKTGAVGVTISELPAAENLTGRECFPVVQGNETRRATVEQVTTLIPAGEPGASAYEVWALSQPEESDTSAAAYLAFQEGKPGESAWQVWAQAQPDGTDISEEAYLESMKGEDGNDGLSAYQIWVAAQEEGADTGEEAYLESMTGKDGTDGLSAYQIWVEAQEEGNDTTEDAYLAFQKGKDGKSAYQIWLDAGNEGTEADFLEWLKANTSVEIDPQPTNMLKSNTSGLYVNGAHPVIPKFVTSTYNGLLDTFKSMTDGTRVYTMTVSLANPLKVTAVGGVGVSRYVAMEPAYYFTNEINQYIPAQYFLTATEITSSNIKITISVIMTEKPYKSWELATLGQVASADDGDLQCKIAIRLMACTTLSQNGMS